MPEHDVIPLGERHGIHNWEYADAAARTAATGFIAADVGKWAKQLDDGTYWELTDDSPVTWAQRTFTTNIKFKTIPFIFDGGGSVIQTGIHGDIGPLDFSGTIQAVTLLADQSGSIVVDIWKDTFANFPPTDADSITGAAPATLSGTDKSQDSTLTGWTTAINAGDILRFNVDSIATVTRVTLALRVLAS